MNEDVTVSVGAPTGERHLFFVVNTNTTGHSPLVAVNGVNLFSGDVEPTVTTQTAYWFDTASNYIKRTQDTGTTWPSIGETLLYTLPICIATFDTGACKSIDQTFNGLGYIGSTAFVLPGVKGLISYGRNADGSLKNAEIATAKVATCNTFNNYYQAVNLYVDGSLGVYGFEGIFNQTIPPTRAGANLWYNSETNCWKYTENGGSTWNPIRLMPVASAKTATAITSFQSKPPFHAVDYSEVKNVVFPPQIGNAGKALFTDGENTYWGDSTNKPVTTLTYSSTVSLSTNNIYTITLSGNVTFSLPQATAGVLNQIEVQLYMPSVYTINLGTTTYFGGEAPDISEAGYYTIIYEYDNIHSVWVVGSLKKASA